MFDQSLTAEGAAAGGLLSWHILLVAAVLHAVVAHGAALWANWVLKCCYCLAAGLSLAAVSEDVRALAGELFVAPNPSKFPRKLLKPWFLVPHWQLVSAAAGKVVWSAAHADVTLVQGRLWFRHIVCDESGYCCKRHEAVLGLAWLCCLPAVQPPAPSASGGFWVNR